MKRGLVIGKFMPVHQGHLALIHFAKQQCNELIVSMSYTPHDPIDHQLRLVWLKELLKNEENIFVEESIDDFDQPDLPLLTRTAVWAAFIKKRFARIDVLFSSEEYGELFAQHLGVPHILFDQQRNQFPVSATQIRNDPFSNWKFIPDIVKPYFVKNICFYGTESTGKSTMAKKMAALYETEFVPEVAREMITTNDFSLDDIIKIGHAQHERVKQKMLTANKILFCDTDLITTQIYSRHYLHTVPNIIFELEKQIHFDAYFFFDIDTPWINDGLRDLGEETQRQYMKDIFLSELNRRKIDFTMVRGSWTEKELIIQSAIEKKWNIKPVAR